MTAIRRTNKGGFTLVDTALHDLVTRASRRNGLKPCLLYVDDPGSLSPYGLRDSADSSARSNAWTLSERINSSARRNVVLWAVAVFVVRRRKVVPILARTFVA